MRIIGCSVCKGRSRRRRCLDGKRIHVLVTKDTPHHLWTQQPSPKVGTRACQNPRGCMTCTASATLRNGNSCSAASRELCERSRGLVATKRRRHKRIGSGKCLAHAGALDTARSAVCRTGPSATLAAPHGWSHPETRLRGHGKREKLGRSAVGHPAFAQEGPRGLVRRLMLGSGPPVHGAAR